MHLKIYRDTSCQVVTIAESETEGPGKSAQQTAAPRLCTEIRAGKGSGSRGPGDAGVAVENDELCGATTRKQDRMPPA